MSDSPAPAEPSPGLVQQDEVEVSFVRRIPPVAFALLTLAFVFFLYQGIGGLFTLILFKAEFTEENINAVRWFLWFGQIVFLLVPTCILAHARYGRVLNYFRVKRPDFKLIALTVVAVFALQQLLQGYLLLQEAVPLPDVLEEFIRRFKQMIEDTYRVLVTANTPLEFLSVVAIVAITPAVCEELLFRGLIQRTFEDALGGVRGAFITGAIFGVYHLNPFILIPLCVLGIFLGLIVQRTQNITLAIGAHFANNLVACIAAYLKIDEDILVVAPLGEVTPVLLAVNYLFFAVVFVVATYYFLEATRPARYTSITNS